MAQHIKNTACPECRKKGKDRHGDNLGVYSDGSEYCWSCGYSNSGSVIRKTSDSLSSVPSRPTSTVRLPADVDASLPEKAWNFIGQFALTELDVIKNNILWSENEQRLCFPIFDDVGVLLAWLGRYLGDQDKPKWLSYGSLNEILHILGPKSSTSCVLVEDLISAIRVSNTGIPVNCLFGSHVSPDRLKRLKNLGFVNIFIWLDKDKQIESLKFTNRARQMGLNAKCIITDRDPKLYCSQDIKNILTPT